MIQGSCEFVQMAANTKLFKTEVRGPKGKSAKSLDAYLLLAWVLYLRLSCWRRLCGKCPELRSGKKKCKGPLQGEGKAADFGIFF
jgi:hypothetical protein